jgi:diguanylate cyclase
MLDVNGLKLINDAFGHLMGDKVLQRAAAIMKRECRIDDIVARFGGDEFVMLLPGTSQSDVELMLNRILTNIGKEDICSVNVSISYGCATKYQSSENISDIFKLAEDHMYRRKLSESKSMHYKTIEIILKTLHEKSEREKKHSDRVSDLSKLIGTALGFNNEDINELITTALMHDIGKIAIDLSILDKPSKLNDSEWVEIQRHPELGYQILRSINEFAKLAEYVLAHHERWDGTGYPRSLRGEEIPLQARIIAVADAYDAMTSDRAYRSSLSKEAALGEIEKNAGTQFDPQIAKLFMEIIAEAEVEACTEVDTDIDTYTEVDIIIAKAKENDKDADIGTETQIDSESYFGYLKS